MQRRIGRAVGVVLDSIRLGVAELVLRVEARELEFRGVAKLGGGGFGGGEKETVFQKIRQHIGVNQERGFTLCRVCVVQRVEFAGEVFE